MGKFRSRGMYCISYYQYFKMNERTKKIKKKIEQKKKMETLEM